MLLPGPYPLFSDAHAHGINNHGWVVGSASEAAPGIARRVATLWGGGAAPSVRLGLLGGGTYSEAREVNDQGFVAGAANSRIGIANRNRAFLWHRDFGMLELPGTGACEATSLNSVNRTGRVTVVGSCVSAGYRRAVRWEVSVAAGA